MHIIKDTEITSMVAPNGLDKVLIHPDGLIQFGDGTSDGKKNLIEKISQMAFGMLGPKATPEEVFSLMGWQRIPNET